jgi:hypothetical protein
MTFSHLLRRVNVLAATLAALGATALFAAPAGASILGQTDCSAQPTSQPFLPWGDNSSYVLAPGGGFSSTGTTWSLSGGARLTAGGDPYNDADVDSPASLALPAGGSVQSPFACVNLDRPTFRFFGRNLGALSTVLVQAVIKVPLGGQVALPVGTLALDGSWQPSATMLTVSGLTSAEVALRFTALTGRAQIDDVFIDPRMRS